MPVIRIDNDEWKVESKKNQAVKNALKLIVTLDEKKIDLSTLVWYIQDASGQNIVVHWDELELVGIERKSAIYLRVKELELGQALQVGLDQVRQTVFEDDRLAYMIEDGVIHISTNRYLKKRTVPVVYDVGWYLVPYDPLQQWLYRDNPRAHEVIKLLQERRELIPKLNPAPVFDLNDALSGTSSGGGKWYRGYIGSGGGEGGLFGDDEDEDEIVKNEDPFAHRTEMLLNLIMSIGDINEWLDEHSIIVVVNDHFTIHTTRENHEKIEKVLKALYQAQVKSHAYEAKLVEVFLLLDDAEQLRLEGNYKAAIKKVQQARIVAPENPEAIALESVLNETIAR